MGKPQQSGLATRRLAAILFTDIVGYTSTMQRNEKLAIAMVKRHQEVLESKAVHHGGEVLHYFGDGSLSIFSSTTAALHCALEMQLEFGTSTPNLVFVPLRIGIHIGEILFKDGEVYGDGVNIASRIESAGESGTVLFSRHVYDKIKNNPDFEAISLGFCRFKNVEQPMEVFALANNGCTVPDPNHLAIPFVHPAKGSKTPVRLVRWFILLGIVMIMTLVIGLYHNFNNSKISDYIAVLPVENKNEKPELDYLSMGITEEIISELIKVRALRVKSFLSTKSYKNTNKTVKEISQELDAPLLLRGGIWNFGDSIRFSYELIQAQNDEPLTINGFQIHNSKLMTISSEIAKQIVEVLGIKMYPEEKKHIEQLPTPMSKAFDLYLKARSKHLLGMTKQDLQSMYESNDLLRRAISIDSNFAKAYSMLAWNYQTLAFPTTGGMDFKEAEKLAYPLIQKSIELDPSSSDTYLIEGSINFFLKMDFKEADKNFKKAMELWNWYNRPTPYCFCGYSNFLIANRRFEETHELIENVKSIDPGYVYGDADQGRVYFLTNQLDKAIPAIKKTIRTSPILYWYQLLGRVYIQKGEFQTAIDSLENGLSKYLHIRPALTLGFLATAYHKAGQAGKSETIMQELNERLTKNEDDINYTLAFIAAAKGNYEEAMDGLEQAYQKGDLSLIWVNTEPYFKPLYQEERFQTLIEKIGFQYTAIPVHKN